MAIDFTKIPDGENFELFCRDILEDMGIKILSHPSRGPDRNQDLIIEIESTSPIGNSYIDKFIVQCKHFAKSGRSVSSNDVGNWQSACDVHDATGYFLITSTTPTSNLNGEFGAANDKKRYKTLIWDKMQLESHLEKCPNRLSILLRYGFTTDDPILFDYSKKIIDGFDNLPFSYLESCNLTEYQIHIYEEEKEKDGQLMKIRYGFICVYEKNSTQFYQKIKSNHNLSIIYVITGQDEVKQTLDQIDHLSLIGLNQMLNGYKDIWYQSNSLFLFMNQIFQSSGRNPYAIRVLEMLFNGNPYKIQSEVILYFKENISNIMVFDEDNVLIILEMLEIIRKKKISELGISITALINNVISNQIDEFHKSFLLKRALDTLGEIDLDNECSHFVERLFTNTNSLEIKVDCLHYFTARRNNLIQKKAIKLKKRKGSIFVPGRNHATHYNNTRIKLVADYAQVKIEVEVDKYLKLFQ